VRQHRDRHDRRVVWTQISETGLALLAEMDPVIKKVPIELLGHLSREQIAQFIQLLELARSRSGETQAPLSCGGERCAEETAGAAAEPA
jgi:DNA-binding MarR family transcriptional regulator